MYHTFNDSSFFTFQKAPRYRDQIEIKTSFFDGMKYIIEHHGEYDCVILDIDMNKNFQMDLVKEAELWTRFSKYVHINGGLASDTAGKDLQEYAGFYLIALLNTLGFPKDRIVIFSAFSDTDSKDKQKNLKGKIEKWEGLFNNASMHMPEPIDKGRNWQNNIHKGLNEFLNKKFMQDEYYKTRLFIHQMYNFVQKYYSEIEQEEFELRKKTDTTIDWDSCMMFNRCCKQIKLKKEDIIKLYEDILFYFPCFKPPKNIEKNYFYAMRQFSVPFEAEYDSKKVIPSFRILKLFRNWNAHNKFKKGESMNADIFRFLFFIESLLFVESIKNPDRYPEAKEFKEWETYKWYYQDWKREDCNDDNICKELEKQNWAICKSRGKLPKDMLAVYDDVGRKTDVSYSYLMSAYMDDFIDKKIEYTDSGCKSDYCFQDDCKNNGMRTDLFYIAYNIYKTYHGDIHGDNKAESRDADDEPIEAGSKAK